MTGARRRYPVGAELHADAHASIRVWAPAHRTVNVVVDGESSAMQPQTEGYFEALVTATAGSRYAFRFEGEARLYPDPASRWQPDGPDGLSAIVDLSAYAWHDAAWPGIDLPGQVIYELHVGTFTTAGTWRGAEAELPRLRQLGITVIQMMPVAEFAGHFGWGYDGVQWFAPTRNYGAPADLQHFVDVAHQLGLAVILDVVYNHLGPAGNFLAHFSPHYFTDRHGNEWGQAVNFDDDQSYAMRELVLSNVTYWICEFHVDGFRLDAAQQIFDDSPEHLLAALTRTARAAAAPRPIVVLAEHEPQHARLLRPPPLGGYGLDGIYNEDFHHSARVALTGVREAYLSDYAGTSREWLAAAQWGFLFQGQHYPWQGAPRGAPALDRPAFQFVNFLENHDQVSNSVTSQRLVALTHPGWWRAMSALLLLGPWTPLLFQGQEWGSTQPFGYFTDHAPELQAAVLAGRNGFLSQFQRLGAQTIGSLDAIGRAGFDAAKLQRTTTPASTATWAMHRDLLALRQNDGVLGQHATTLAGATISERALLLRYRADQPDADRLLVINLTPDVNIAILPEPLVAPPEHRTWAVTWCSEDPKYGGGGIARAAQPNQTVATGYAATVFIPRRITDA